MHPGTLLRDRTLPALGLGVPAAARALGVSRAALYAVLSGRAAVSPAMALRLERLTGERAETWLARQADYDLARTRAQQKGEG